jgi:hypothetical protein
LQIAKMDRIGDGNAEHWEVLRVLGEDHRTCLQDQDAVAMGFVNGKQMLRHRSAEGPPTNDDDVEGASIGAQTLVHAPLGLVEAIANVAAQDIAAEVGRLGERGGSHRIVLP